MKPLPLRVRQGAVQRADQQPTQAILKARRGIVAPGSAEWLAHYMDWQSWARRFARLGVVRFAAGITADTVARCLPRVEQRNDRGDWVEVEDDARLIGIFDEYRNARQTPAELVRVHAWHYSIAGEMLQVVRDTPTGIEWSIHSVAAVEWNKPEEGSATVRVVPEGKMADETAFVVPMTQITRFWQPDEEWPGFATSPLASSIDDLKRWRALGARTVATVESALAMNGFVWMPDDDWATVAPPVDPEANDAGEPETTMEDEYWQIARQRFNESDDIAAIAPHLLHWKATLGEPKYVKVGQDLDPNAIAYRNEALQDFARGSNLPASLVVGGGPGDANHWTEWLVDDKFFDSAIAPTADKVFHSDLTATFLRPRLRVAGYDVTRYRIGYDANPVIVRPDQSGMAIALWSAGLLQARAALEMCNVDADKLAQPADLDRLMLILTKRRELDNPGDGGMTDVTRLPLSSTNELPPTGAGTPGAPAAPPPPQTKVAAILAAALNGAHRRDAD